MPHHPSALSEMRLATRDIHETLERLLPVARPDATRSDYDLYLQDLWGWLAPFEARLWCAGWPPEMKADERAGKLAWIESDLRHLHPGGDVCATLPVSTFALDLASLPKRFGVAYVIEGAQLGTRVLAKRLGPQLAPWMPRWLSGYGEHSGSNWRTFVDCAERCLDNPAARSEAAHAAAQAFASLAEWFSGRGRRRGALIVQQLPSVAGETGGVGAAELIGSPM